MNVRTGKEGGLKKKREVYISDLRGGIRHDFFGMGPVQNVCVRVLSRDTQRWTKLSLAILQRCHYNTI